MIKPFWRDFAHISRSFWTSARARHAEWPYETGAASGARFGTLRLPYDLGTASGPLLVALSHDAGRSVGLPVHWPLEPAPFPPLVGGAGLARAAGAIAAAKSAPLARIAAALRLMDFLLRD
jgi:hypothetical protein